MDTILRAVESLAKFLQEYPVAAALMIALIVSIALTEIVKSMWRTLFPGYVKNDAVRRNVYWTITAVVHWIVVFRIYSLARGPFLYDVAIFSPVVSAVIVWIMHRLIESLAVTRGPDSIWSMVLAKMKPHRVVRRGSENGATHYILDDNTTLLLKKKQEKQHD